MPSPPRCSAKRRRCGSRNWWHAAARPCLVVSITPRTAPPRPDLAAIAAAGQFELAAAVEEAFWKEIKQFYQRAGDLTRVTFEWLGVAA